MENFIVFTTIEGKVVVLNPEIISSILESETTTPSGKIKFTQIWYAGGNCNYKALETMEEILPPILYNKYVACKVKNKLVQSK